MTRSSRNSIKDVWGKRTPYEAEWPTRVDQRTEVEPDRWVQSCCVLCSSGCALDIGVKDGRIVGVRGRAEDPAGRAVLKAAEYRPPEEPDDDYPFWLTTGRVVYHFHTRTKTGRSRELNLAAPEVFAQLHEEDARRLGGKEGDQVDISSRRGMVRARVRLGGVGRGHVFLPFHYGYLDEEGDEHRRAANELTLTAWDPVSKQPYFKFAAVSVAKAARRGLAARVADAAAHVGDRVSELADKVMASAHAERRHLADYLGLLGEAHEQFQAWGGTRPGFGHVPQKGRCHDEENYGGRPPLRPRRPGVRVVHELGQGPRNPGSRPGSARDGGPQGVGRDRQHRHVSAGRFVRRAGHDRSPLPGQAPERGRREP